MKKPTIDEIKTYAKSINFNLDAELFYDFYESKGWKVGKSPMVNWEACVRTWKRGRGATVTVANTVTVQTKTPRQLAMESMR